MLDVQALGQHGRLYLRSRRVVVVAGRIACVHAEREARRDKARTQRYTRRSIHGMITVLQFRHERGTQPV